MTRAQNSRALSPDQTRRVPLSHQLTELCGRLGEQPVRLAELSFVFQGRAVNLLLIVLALPFLTPVALPFVSTPFGLLIAFTGICMALRRKTWMPARLAMKKVPSGAFLKVVRATGRFVGWLERFARPRWVYPEHMRVFRRVTGGLIAAAGLLLALPLPIPFSNLFPAGAVVFLAVGGLQRDGLFFLVGSGALLLALSYFAGLSFAGAELLRGIFTAS